MLTSLDPTNRSALQYNENAAAFLTSLCEPLFDNFGITFFSYSHFFNNGTYLDLCTDTTWQKHYIEHYAAQKFIADYIKNIHQNRIRYVVWNNDWEEPQDKILTGVIVDSCGFDIWHGFSIYKHYSSSVEAWHFATTKENYKLINFYLNHLDLLEHFIFYFRDKASYFIDPSDLSKLVILNDQSNFISNSEKCLIEEKIKEYLQQTNHKKYFFNTPNGIISLSRRETECMVHLSTSKTIKEIANLTQLSPRTVEGYIENAKRKLNCWSRAQLLETFSGFIEKPVGILM